MKTEQEVKEKLSTIKKDERLGYPVATIDINAPLALIQLSLETQCDILRWVLSE